MDFIMRKVNGKYPLYADGSGGFNQPIELVNYLFNTSYGDNAALGLSVRRLNNQYLGDCLRVRRASDNTELNIGFVDGGYIDEAAITTFCSGTNGFVSIWYNQDGSEKHARQTNTNNQPKIYDSSTGLIKLNGKVALSFDGSNDSLAIATFSTPALFTHITTGSQSRYFAFQNNNWIFGTNYSIYIYSLGGSHIFAQRPGSGGVFSALQDGGSSGFNSTGNKILTYEISGLTASLPSGVFGTGGSLRLFENDTERAVAYRSPANERVLQDNAVITNTFNISGQGIFTLGLYNEILHFSTPKSYGELDRIRNDINGYYSVY